MPNDANNKNENWTKFENKWRKITGKKYSEIARTPKSTPGGGKSHLAAVAILIDVWSIPSLQVAVYACCYD